MNDLLFACKSPFSEQLQPFCPAPTGQRSVAHHRGDPTTPWREEYIVERPKISITRLYSAKDYAVKGKKIDGEHTRFATIDRGKDHWWLLVRAWRKDGSSRLLCYDQVPTFERLKATLDLYQVEPRYTFQDCCFEKQKVLQECGEHGWIAVHGLPNIDSFVHVVKDRYGKKIREERRLYSDFVPCFGPGQIRPADESLQPTA